MAGTDRDAKSRAMTERDKIKQRIAKLLNITTDKGASEAEAMQAAEGAAELMAHYDIQASELQIKSARAVSKHALVRRYGNLRYRSARPGAFARQSLGAGGTIPDAPPVTTAILPST